MSEGIRDVQGAQRHALNTIKRKNKQELDQINTAHGKSLQETRKNNANDLYELTQTHQAQKAEAHEKKEQALMEVKNSLERTKNLTEKELKDIQATATQRKSDIQEQGRDQMEVTARRHTESMDEMNQRFNSKFRELNEEAQSKLNITEDLNRQNLSLVNEQGKQKIDQRRTQFNENYNAEDLKFQRIQNKQLADNKRQVLTVHQNHEKKMEEINNQHVQHSEKVTAHNQKALYDKDIFFEKKYQTQLAQHNASEQLLEKLHKKVVDDSTERVMKRTEMVNDRAGDKFFEFTELRPTITEGPEFYTIKIKVPEYAKEEVSLSTNGKEVVMTSNRRHTDERKDEDGSVKKISRVESMVSRIPVSQVLNPKFLKKEWIDGELVFTVKKA